MKRNVIKLTRHKGFIIALCDDGTMWIANILSTGSASWRKIHDVPQPDFDGEV